jgi:hypothetical protein
MRPEAGAFTDVEDEVAAACAPPPVRAPIEAATATATRAYRPVARERRLVAGPWVRDEVIMRPISTEI